MGFLDNPVHLIISFCFVSKQCLAIKILYPSPPRAKIVGINLHLHQAEPLLKGLFPQIRGPCVARDVVVSKHC